MITPAVETHRGLFEVIPRMLYVSSASAVRFAITHLNIRCVVSCTGASEEAPDYNQILADHLRKKFLAENLPAPSVPVEHSSGQQEQEQHDFSAVPDCEEEVEGEEENTPLAKEAGPQPEEEAFQRWLTQQENRDMKVHRCSLEDNSECSIWVTIPAAVDFISRMLESCCALEPQGEDEVDIDGIIDEQPAVVPAPVDRNLSETENSGIIFFHQPLPHAVLVHCHAGVSRSPTVVASYLLTQERRSLTSIMNEALPPTVKPNPNFMLQLCALEREVFDEGTCSFFDIRQYFLEGLESCFQGMSRSEIVAEFDRCGEDVYKARSILMKRQLFKMDKDEMMVDAMCKVVNTKFVSREEVKAVYASEGKKRDAALLKLLTLQNFREEEANKQSVKESRRIGASKSQE